MMDRSLSRFLVPMLLNPPTTLAGKVEILGDIINPIVDEADWECLK
jgi:hypothetical protein